MIPRKYAYLLMLCMFAMWALGFATGYLIGVRPTPPPDWPHQTINKKG